MGIDPKELQEFYDEKKGPRERLNLLVHGNRAVSAFWLTKTKAGFTSKRVWPALVILAVLFIWAVNAVTDGALRFITDWPNWLVIAAVTGLVVFLVRLRRKRTSFSADEIAAIEAQAEKDRQG